MDNNLNEELISLSDKYLTKKDWMRIQINELYNEDETNKSIGRTCVYASIFLIVSALLIMGVPLLSLL